MRLTDVDPGIRLEAFNKLLAFGIKLEDFES
jgi:hypothetical protein